MSTKVSRAALINITIVVEAILLLAATGWSQMAGIPLLPALHFEFKPMLIGLGSGFIMAFLGYAAFVLASKTNTFPGLRDLVENFLLPMVSELKPIDLIIMSVLSGFCEEIFFRGVAQQQFHVLITSLGFGVFHDPSFRHPSYIIIAFIYSVCLGWLYIYTGNLWAPIFAHITHNLVSLLLLRYRIKPPAIAS